MNLNLSSHKVDPSEIGLSQHQLMSVSSMGTKNKQQEQPPRNSQDISTINIHNDLLINWYDLMVVQNPKNFVNLIEFRRNLYDLIQDLEYSCREEVVRDVLMRRITTDHPCVLNSVYADRQSSIASPTRGSQLSSCRSSLQSMILAQEPNNTSKTTTSVSQIINRAVCSIPTDPWGRLMPRITTRFYTEFGCIGHSESNPIYCHHVDSLHFDWKSIVSQLNIRQYKKHRESILSELIMAKDVENRRILLPSKEEPMNRPFVPSKHLSEVMSCRKLSIIISVDITDFSNRHQTDSIDKVKPLSIFDEFPVAPELIVSYMLTNITQLLSKYGLSLTTYSTSTRKRKVKQSTKSKSLSNLISNSLKSSTENTKQSHDNKPLPVNTHKYIKYLDICLSLSICRQGRHFPPSEFSSNIIEDEDICDYNIDPFVDANFLPPRNIRFTNVVQHQRKQSFLKSLKKCCFCQTSVIHSINPSLMKMSIDIYHRDHVEEKTLILSWIVNTCLKFNYIVYGVSEYLSSTPVESLGSVNLLNDTSRLKIDLILYDCYPYFTGICDLLLDRISNKCDPYNPNMENESLATDCRQNGNSTTSLLSEDNLERFNNLSTSNVDYTIANEIVHSGYSRLVSRLVNYRQNNIDESSTRLEKLRHALIGLSDLSSVGPSADPMIQLPSTFNVSNTHYGKMGCTAIVASIGATDTNTGAIAGMNADCATCDARVAFVPRRPVQAERKVFSNGGEFPRFLSKERNVSIYLNDINSLFKGQPELQPVGVIVEKDDLPNKDQKEIYGYYESTLPLHNDVGLSMAESSCGTRLVNLENGAGTSSYNNLLDVGELMKIGLERCDSAECGVEVMGKAVDDYGFRIQEFELSPGLDPHGKPAWDDAGEAVVLADKSGDAWVFHVAGGVDGICKSVWVAQRVPPGKMGVISNSFIIGEVDFKDTHNFKYADCLEEATRHLKPSADLPLHWSRDVGFNVPKFHTGFNKGDSQPIPMYTSLRTWRVLNLVGATEYSSDHIPVEMDYINYPSFFTPREPLSLTQVFNLFRDYYKDSEFDLTEGTVAGPFNSPFRVEGGDALNSRGQFARAINIQRTAYSIVGESSVNGAPTVAWFASDAPATSVYVPLYGESEEGRVDNSYERGTLWSYDDKSAWWQFNAVAMFTGLNFKSMTERRVFPIRDEAQKEVINMVRSNTDYSPSHLSQIQTSIQNQIHQIWTKLFKQLIGEYNDNFLNLGPSETNPVAQVGQKIGYNSEYLSSIQLDNDVHPIYMTRQTNPHVEDNVIPGKYDFEKEEWILSDRQLGSNVEFVYSYRSILRTLILVISGILIGRYITMRQVERARVKRNMLFGESYYSKLI